MTCPLPLAEYASVQLAHGGGGRLSQSLVEKLFVPAFANDALALLHDGAVLDVAGARMALSTDSFVVRPLFFPGGDIGSLAVHGTLNDLAMCGARPLALALALVLEEGFPMEDLCRVVASIRDAADAAGVPVVTGDTKVVERGKGDGVFITTTGVGLVPAGVVVSPTRAASGDVVLVSGSVAVHGMAIMSVREGLGFETELRSDSANLVPLVDRILQEGGSHVHVLRDPTRGGVASALCEIAARAGCGIVVEEAAVPVPEEVRGACEILGLDPLYVANEGKCLVVVAPEAADAVLAAMRAHPLGAEAARIGVVTEGADGRVMVRGALGAERLLQPMSGEQLPRIC